MGHGISKRAPCRQKPAQRSSVGRPGSPGQTSRCQNRHMHGMQSSRASMMGQGLDFPLSRFLSLSLSSFTLFSLCISSRAGIPWHDMEPADCCLAAVLHYLHDISARYIVVTYCPFLTSQLSLCRCQLPARVRSLVGAFVDIGWHFYSPY